mgnify:CR=1 FL=1
MQEGREMFLNQNLKVLLFLIVELPLLWIMFFKLHNASSSFDYFQVARMLKVVTVAGMLVILSTGF